MNPGLAHRVTRGCSAALLLLGCALAQAGEAAAEPPAPTAARELVVCADPENLPHTNDRLEGFENRIAAALAGELKAELRYEWQLQRVGFLRRGLLAGRCDVVLGVPPGLPGVLTSRPYYRSSYVMVTRRADPALQGLDDPALAHLRIGLPAVGHDGANTPPAMGLARRGLSGQVTGFAVWGDESGAGPRGQPIEALARGEIDATFLWGPLAGFHARAYPGKLRLTALQEDARQPGVPFEYDIALAVRRTDSAFLAELQVALDRLAPQIHRILDEWGVPVVDSPTPSGPIAAATPRS